MNNDIKEILDYFRKYMTIEDCIRLSKIEDYITNLQEELKSANESIEDIVSSDTNNIFFILLLLCH